MTSAPAVRTGAEESTAAGPLPTRWPWWQLVALLLAGAGILALFLVASFHAVGGNSDGATVVLEGQAISHGHVLLSGWSLSDDSFWTIDAPLYAIGVALFGVRTSLLNVVPCVIAALVVVLAVVFATERRRGTAAVASALVVFGLLALPGRALSMFLLAGPLHVGTVLLALLGFAGLEHQRFRIGFFIAVVSFAAGLLGDLQMLALGVLPAFGAGLLALWRTRSWRAAAVGVVAPVASVLLAAVVRIVAIAFGTFRIARANPFASGHQILDNIRHLFSFGSALIGLDNGPFGTTGVPLPLALVHLVGLVVVLGGPGIALWNLVRRSFRGTAARRERPTWQLDDALALGFVADLVTFVILPITSSNAYARYLTAAVVFGTVLGARVVGRLVQSLQPRRRSLAAAVGLAALACFGAGFALSLRGPASPRPAPGLTTFLAAHGLTRGIGDYWSSSILTVESGGAVAVRPVVTTPMGRLVRYDKQSAASWYAHSAFQFYVYNTALIWNGDDRAVAVTTFGRPRVTYAFASYRILVWKRPISVSVNGSIGP